MNALSRLQAPLLSVLRIVSDYLFIWHGTAKVFGTRPVAFLLSGQMAVAYFMAHAAQGNVLMPMANSGELAVLFCFVFLYLSAAGGGNLSLDQLRGK